MEYDEMEFENEECSKKCFTVLSEADVRGRIDADITHICSAIHVSRGVARLLLAKFNWNVVDVSDAWFSDEQHVRHNVGLLNTDQCSASKEVWSFVCLICSGDFSGDDMVSACCDHLFCKECYKSYAESMINNGHGCVIIKCPQPNCVAVVADDVIGTLVSGECGEKFDSFVVRSYVEGRKNIKWCPAPGCCYMIELELGNDRYDVRCDCSHVFCWKCAEEVHRPVDCETAKAWSLMSSDMSADSLWILAYTKPCPKCKKPIEKNSGCIYMTCPQPCYHRFCWLCLGDWDEHDNLGFDDLYLDHGGFTKCDRYNEQRELGEIDVEVTRRVAANHLRSYVHYSQRWALHQSLIHKDQEKLMDWKSKNLGEVIGKPEFVIEAWQQIIECRGVLKWCSAYAYYMNREQRRKKQYFKCLQGEAEARLERLHDCAEKDLVEYINACGEEPAIKRKVIQLTKATSRFFDSFVRTLENGLEDADGLGDCRRQSKNYRAYVSSSSTRYDEDMVVDDDSDYDDYTNGWDCPHCTYFNFNVDAKECEMCALPKQGAY